MSLPLMYALLATDAAVGCIPGALPKYEQNLGPAAPSLADKCSGTVRLTLCLRGGVKLVGGAPLVRDSSPGGMIAARGGKKISQSGNEHAMSLKARIAKKKQVKGKEGFMASMHHSKLQYLAPHGRVKEGKRSYKDARDKRRSQAGAQARYERRCARNRSRGTDHSSHTDAEEEDAGAVDEREEETEDTAEGRGSFSDEATLRDGTGGMASGRGGGGVGWGEGGVGGRLEVGDADTNMCGDREADEHEVSTGSGVVDGGRRRGLWDGPGADQEIGLSQLSSNEVSADKNTRSQGRWGKSRRRGARERGGGERRRRRERDKGERRST